MPPPLRRRSTLGGGASEFPSAASSPCEGSGVALDSEVLSVLSGGCTEGDGSGLIEGGIGVAKARSFSGDRRRMTILLFLLFFDEEVRALLGVVDDMVVDTVDGYCVCSLMVERLWKRRGVSLLVTSLLGRFP